MSNLLGCIECRKEQDVYPETAKPLPHDALPVSGTSYTISRGQYDVDKWMQRRDQTLSEAFGMLDLRKEWVVEYIGTGAVIKPARFATRRVPGLQHTMAAQGSVVILQDESAFRDVMRMPRSRHGVY